MVLHIQVSVGLFTGFTLFWALQIPWISKRLNLTINLTIIGFYLNSVLPKCCQDMGKYCNTKKKIIYYFTWYGGTVGPVDVLSRDYQNFFDGWITKRYKPCRASNRSQQKSQILRDFQRQIHGKIGQFCRIFAEIFRLTLPKNNL